MYDAWPRSLHALALADGISVAQAEASAAIANATYYAAGSAVTLAYGGIVPPGYAIAGYMVNGVDFEGDAITMPIADATVVGRFSPITYSITYDLAGGRVTGNPVSYTVTNAIFTLNNPTRQGFSFAGWTGTGLARPTNEVILATGSTGDRSYTANWDPLAPWSGSGTAEDPFVIASTNDLSTLAGYVNGDNSLDGVYFLQTTNLTYDGTADNYTPVGNADHPFTGIYDGGGHTISGINIERTGTSFTEGNLGLFGFVDDGTVRNVVLADSVIGGVQSVGGIVGYLYGGTVSNCCVGSGVAIKAGGEGAVGHGGIAGMCVGGTIAGCFSAASVTTNGCSGCSYYGGIVGASNGSVENCLYGGSVVEAAHGMGAIVGIDIYDNTFFANNLYTGEGLPGGVNGSDVDGACHAQAIILGEGVGIAGTETVYDVSGITAIGTDALRHVADGVTNLYCRTGGELTLTGGGAGYIATRSDDGSDVSAEVLNESALTMPAYGVTVTAVVTPWKNLQTMIHAANGATIVLDRDYTALDGDSTLRITNAVTLDLNGHTINASNRFVAIEILSDGNLTLTNSVPQSGAITGGAGDYGGGVCMSGGAFTMSGGTISGNTAQFAGGGVCMSGGTFTMSGGTISGNTVETFGGGGVCMMGGTFTVSGSPVVFGNFYSSGNAGNVLLYNGQITVSNLTEGAFLGVSTFQPILFGSANIASGAAAGDDRYFFSDNLSLHVDMAEDKLRLAKGQVYPAYLDGADSTIKSYWNAWATMYGVLTNAAYESSFLLNISPRAPIPADASLLKMVDFQVTANGYRFELASDVGTLYHPDGDDALLCNGYAAVKIAADLAEFSRNAASAQNAKGSAKVVRPTIDVDVEKITLPVPVTIDAATGHAVIDLDLSAYGGRKSVYVTSFTLPPPPLFFRVQLTPIKPDYEQEILDAR